MTELPEERTALFVDGANLHYASRALGFGIDYRRLLERFAAEGRLVRAYYYTALFDEAEYSPIRPLIDWLAYNGYSPVTKRAREFTDNHGNRRVKGDMDVEIAVDMMALAGRVDRMVLFSGDGDFRRLVEAVQREGVRVSVISTLRSSPPMAADELRRQADDFIDLADLAPEIARPPRGTGEPVPTPARPDPGGGEYD